MPNTSWFHGAMALTIEAEGGFISLNLNTDGAGLSFGILQWSQRTGALGKLLAEFYRHSEAKFIGIFGSRSSLKLLEATAAGSLDPVGGVVLWKEPWVSRFRLAGKDVEYQAIQYRLACKGEYMKAAIQAAKAIGIPSQRCLALMFDTAVQQGTGKVTSAATAVGAAYADADPMLKMQHFVTHIASKFRRTVNPGTHKNPNLQWKQVGQEWHAFAGKVDLYADVTRRRNAILTSTRLSDELVELD